MSEDPTLSRAALQHRLAHLLAADGVGHPGDAFAEAITLTNAVEATRGDYIRWWRSGGRPLEESAAGRLHLWLGGRADARLSAVQADGVVLVEILGDHELPPADLSPEAVGCLEDAQLPVVQRAWLTRQLLESPGPHLGAPVGQMCASLSEPGDWRAWLNLLARHPGREQELDARGAALVASYRDLDAERPVEKALQDLTAEQPVAADRSIELQRRWPWIVGFGVAFLVWSLIFAVF